MSTATTTLITETTPRQTARAEIDTYRDVRRSAAEAIANLTAAEAPLRARRQALQLDVRLGRAGAEAERDQVAAQLAAVEARLVEQRELAAEAARREPAAVQALHAAALADLEAMRVEMETKERGFIAQIHRERERTPAEVCEQVVTIARQLGGFEADMQEVMNAPRFVRRAGLRERLGPELAALIPGLAVRPHEHKPAIERPWTALLADLAETAR
jgi:hypothetical protein